MSAHLCRRAPTWGFAIGAESFGSDAYRETLAHVALGARVRGPLSAGLAVDVAQVAIDGAGNGRSCGLTFSGAVAASKDVSMWCNAESVWARDAGDLVLDVPRALAVGASYAASRMVTLDGYARTESGSRWSAAGNLTVAPFGWLAVRFGRALGPSGFVCGATIATNSFVVGYNVRFHPVLAATHMLSVGIERRTVAPDQASGFIAPDTPP